MTAQEVSQKFKDLAKEAGQVSTARNQHARMEFYFTYTGKDRSWETLSDATIDGTSPHFLRVRRILDSPDKFSRYQQFFNNPIPSALSSIIPDLNAATRAVDKFIDLQMDSEELKAQVLELAKPIERYFELKAIKDTLLAPSTVLVVDTKPDGSPFFWKPDIGQILAFELDQESSFTFLVLLRKDGLRAVYCPEFYRIYGKDDAELLLPIEEQPHGLGYCPARFLWDEPITTPERFLRRTNATAHEGALDDYIFQNTSRQNQEAFGLYFITTRVQEQCTVTKQGRRCNGEYFDLQDEDGNWAQIKCDCQKSKFLGPGSELQITLGENDKNALPKLVEFISPEVGLLEFNKARTNEHAAALLDILAGGNPEGFNNKAVNEDQVRGIFERKNKLIANYARTLERAHQFLLQSFARLISEGDVKCTVDYGSIFQIETTTYLNDQLLKSRAAGAGLGKILALQNKINTNEAKTMAEAARLTVIDMLPDLPGLTTEQLAALFAAGGIDALTLNYHLQLPALICRYERTKGQIVGDEDVVNLKKELLSLVLMPNIENQAPQPNS
jgi:hypothetical protein